MRSGGADFIVRRGLTSCRLLHADGAKFELARTLVAVGCRQTLDIPVLVPLPAEIGGPPTAETGTVSPVRARLIIRHLGPEAAVAARRRATRKAAKQGQKATAKRLRAAEYIMLLTSLDAAEFSPDQVLDLYRLRWQIEIAFKRLKSVLGFADLAAKDPQLVRACLYAKLIVALLCEDILQDLLDSPPLPHATSPPSLWRLLRLVLEALLTAICGRLVLADCVERLRRIKRNIAEPRRRRCSHAIRARTRLS